MKGWCGLLGVEKTIQGGISRADSDLVLTLQVLVDQSCAACPERSGGTGAANLNPAAEATTGVGHCAVDGVAGIWISIG